MKIFPTDVYKGLLEQLPGATCVDAADLLRKCREIYYPAEREFLSIAGEFADEGFEALPEATRRGVREKRRSGLTK